MIYKILYRDKLLEKDADRHAVPTDRKRQTIHEELQQIQNSKILLYKHGL